MAPGAQSVSDFVSGRLTTGFHGALTLEERRRRMREGAEHVRSSVSPRPRRSNLQRTDSMSSRTTSSSSIDRAVAVRRGDRWDTDTEQLDDTSTITAATILDPHELKIEETGQLHDFAASPAPDEYSVSEISATEDDDDTSSLTASVRTESTQHYQPKTFGGTLSGRGTNTWTSPNRYRASSNVGNSLAQINGHSAQQHHFSRQSMVGISLPFHSKPQTSSTSLRPREASAPPPTTAPRVRAFSPVDRRETITTPTGYFAHAYSNHPTSHPMTNGDHQTPTIDENGEYQTEPGAVYGQARQVPIRHSYSMSNMSQTSMRSRDSSVNGRTSRNGMGRFRTKRSHVALRRARQNSAEAELEYTPAELARMTYQQLAEESFDDAAAKNAASSTGPDFPDGVTTLAQKCKHLATVPDSRSEAGINAGAKSLHELFFASLPIDDYEECGDVIVGQLSDIMSRLRQTRQAKRKVARDFENEVAKREQMVSARVDGLQKELTRLKRSGQEALTAAIASNAS